MKAEPKGEEIVDTLREAFAQRLRKAVPEMPTHVALQLGDSLCAVQLDVLAGLRVSYRARVPVDGDAIAADWRRGQEIGEIMSAHKCSRSVAYKYHPNRRVAAANSD